MIIKERGRGELFTIQKHLTMSSMTNIILRNETFILSE